MNTIIKNDIIKQLKELPTDKLERLCDSLGVKDTDNLDLLSERLNDDVFTASLNGISVKREMSVYSYIFENIDSLNVDEAREIIDKYIGLLDDKFSDEDDALVILYNYNDDEEDESEQEVMGVCSYILHRIDSLSSIDARKIVEEYFSEWEDIKFDLNEEDIVIVE